MKISIITIGDELLIGQVVDSNSAKIATMLGNLGLSVHRKWCVGDSREEIEYALAQAEESADLILITGGLGPTKDDITKKIMAEYFNNDLVFSDQHLLHLEKMLKPRGIEVTDAHKTQCYVPDHAELLDNQLGTALGLKMEVKGKTWISMPGVPYEMEYIMEHSVLPYLMTINQDKHWYAYTINSIGMGETEIASIIEPLLEDMPSYISIAYLPSISMVRVRLTGNHSDPVFLKSQVDAYAKIAEDSLGSKVLNRNNSTIEAEIAHLLLKQNKTIGTAESCTGGNIASKITSIPGCSKYFIGSIVAYSYEVKTHLLNVSKERLVEFGAVSEETVISMMVGACESLHADFTIAVSGIAGPDGGTPDKPVGTVWIAVGNALRYKTKKLKLSRDRHRNIEAASILALILAREWLLD